MAKIELKKPIVDEISNVLDGSAAAVLVNARGLTVAEDTELRKTLRAAGIQYKVYKNTYIHLAVKGTGNEGLTPLLEGPTALAVSKDDPVVAERILAKYVKAHKCFNFVGGVIEGQYADPDKLQEMANIPSREVLLGRLFGSMQSPIANFARVVKQIAEKDGEGAAEAPAAEA